MIRIVQQNDKPFRLELYTPSKGPGAFAVGETPEQRRYYRGGSSEDLVKAVITAYDNSNN